MIQPIQHAALYVHAEQDRKWLVEEIRKGRIIPGTDDLAVRRVEVFSADTLQYFVNEEVRHDRYQVDTGLSTSLSNASSGEQRKALIRHILSSNPSGIILDDVYESLDVQTRAWVLQTLTGIQDQVQLVQIFSRKADLLPFIKTIYVMSGETVEHSLDRYSFEHETAHAPAVDAVANVPPPLHSYEYPSDVLVRMNAVSVSYNDRPILNNISWEIRVREFWQLMGANG